MSYPANPPRSPLIPLPVNSSASHRLLFLLTLFLLSSLTSSFYPSTSPTSHLHPSTVSKPHSLHFRDTPDSSSPPIPAFTSDVSLNFPLLESPVLPKVKIGGGGARGKNRKLGRSRGGIDEVSLFSVYENMSGIG